MSGIAGALGKDSKEATTTMLNILRHRGPDNCKVLSGKLHNGVEYAIGAANLLLLGTNPQPEETTLGLSACDGCTVGQYAKIQIQHSECVSLARDLIGEKPLFYGANKDLDLIAFASERKALWGINIGCAKRVKPGQVIKLSHSQNIAKTRVIDDFFRQDTTIYDETFAIGELLTRLRETTNEKRYSPMGLAFSGGVDSTLLWALLEDPDDVILYTAGTASSFDIKNAANRARLLGADLRVVVLTPAYIETIIPQVMRAIESCNAMDVAIVLPLYAICKALHADGLRVIMAGQGADELFGGYNRYLDAREVSSQALDDALRRDISNIAKNNLERDNLAASANSVELSLPYLGLKVVQFAMNLTTELKIKNGTRKHILRQAALRVLPEHVATQPKKAIQYGSGVSNVLQKLAHNHFLNTKADKKELVSSYLKAVAREYHIRVVE